MHELARLREKVVLFLDAKNIIGARGHRVTPRQRVVIALQACVLILNLDIAFYDGWENVIVYPDEFVPGLGMGGRGRRRASQRRTRWPARRLKAARWSCPGPTSKRVRTGRRRA